MTGLRTAVASATERLAAAGVASPEHDARALAVHVLGLQKPSDLLLADGFDDTQAQQYDALVGRRADRVPLQHLTGSVGFRHIELEIGPGVFVPRPETESVVGWAIDAVRAMDVAEPCVVDLCTGSGAIALALAQEVPRSRVHAVELSEEALVWTRKNMEGSRVDLRQGDAAGHRDARR